MLLVSWYHICPLLKSLPQPTGAYAVAMGTFHWIDQSRSDARQESGHREVVVQVFYPSSADKNKAQSQPYQPYELVGLAKFHAQHIWPHSVGLWRDCLLHNITSYAGIGYIAQNGAPFPIILFLPGISGDPLYNVYLEELGSIYI